jgi:protein-S-isoprenylcysteine O-methyltransferase Ste14
MRTGFLELRVPPLIVMLLIGAGMWGVSRFTTGLGTSEPVRLGLSAILLLLGVACAALGVLEFRRARTTVDPTDPAKSSAIVTRGIYQLTRNPMYLGFLLVLAAWGTWLANPAAYAGPVLFALYMTRYQIIPEERALRARFGAPYDAYVRRVRRWL